MALSCGFVRSVRKCSRAGCQNAAVATLTYAYADSTAVVGPLASYAEPHSYDLCERHALRLTVPRGWEVVRHEGGFADAEAAVDDLTALAEAVREAGRADCPAEPPPVSVNTTVNTNVNTTGVNTTGRRGHLRVLPDPNG